LNVTFQRFQFSNEIKIDVTQSAVVSEGHPVVRAIADHVGLDFVENEFDKFFEIYLNTFFGLDVEEVLVNAGL
jgi:hypothetical protein